MKLKKMPKRKQLVSVSPQLDAIDEDFIDDEDCSNDDNKDCPVQRNTANARERARMRVLSSAFYRLKTIIPWVPHDTKLSKLDTLRLARNYISYLTATLDGQAADEITNKFPHPQKLTWPYIFQQPPEVLTQKKISSSSQKRSDCANFDNQMFLTLSNYDEPQSFAVGISENRNYFNLD